MCLRIRRSLRRGFKFKKTPKIKGFQKQQLKNEILRYNAFAFAIFSFHGKLLFKIYPHKFHLWGFCNDLFLSQ